MTRPKTILRAAGYAYDGGLFLLVCHAFITGTDDARLAALEAVVAVAASDPRLVVTTTGKLAAELRTQEDGS